MSQTDAVIRIFLALGIIISFFAGLISGSAGIILLALAVILIITATVNFCPLYLPFGIATRRKKRPSYQS